MKLFAVIILATGLVACSENKTLNTENNPTVTTSKGVDKTGINQENFNGQAAILKEINKEGNQYLISVDNIDEKYSSPNGDGNLKIETINKNPKIRTFKISENTQIQNESCENIDLDTFLTDYQKFLNKGKIAYKAQNGEITYLNLGCWQ